MALCPAPSPSHAEPTLQPSYFTSSLYVEPLRQDVKDLTTLFHEQYTASQSDPPFATFKRVWCSQGWHWLHVRVFDDRTREKFLSVTCRVLLEQSKKHEPSFSRITAILALYTFYSTQPLNTTPALWRLKCIPIPIDQFRDLRTLGEALTTPELIPFHPTLSYILHFLQHNRVFVFLPESSAYPENPRHLPRESYVDQGRIASLDPSIAKKKGRPSKNDKTRKVKAVLSNLEGWLGETQLQADTDAAPLASTSDLVWTKEDEYRLHKSQLLEAIDPLETDSEGCSPITKANQLVLQRLKEIRNLLPQPDGNSMARDDEGNRAGIGRVENAVEDLERGLNRGIFDLLQGSGKR